MDSIRRPAVAGTFYRGDPRALRAEIEDCFTHALGPGAVPAIEPSGPGLLRGLVCPHAGFRYSGAAAAWSYAELARDGRPDVVILIGPNHTGMGEPIAVSGASAWSTPLGDLPVDMGLCNRLADEFPGARLDDSAHRFEHSLEVQLPFVQYLYGREVPIAPIALRTVSSSVAGSEQILHLATLSDAIATAVGGRRAVIIASTDMTHFESHDAASRKDREVLDRALALNAKEMLEAVDAQSVSMCGVLAVATMIEGARLLGANTGRLLTYYTSGDITGDKREVVGYAAARFGADAT